MREGCVSLRGYVFVREGEHGLLGLVCDVVSGWVEGIGGEHEGGEVEEGVGSEGRQSEGNRGNLRRRGGGGERGLGEKGE